MAAEIRKAEEKDFEKILSLFREFAEFENQSDKITNSVERMNREKEYFNCFVAVNDEKEIIGYATYFFAYYTWSGKALYMDDLYVREAFRGKGIGKELLNTVINLASQSGCHKVRWQVANWNKPAIDLYRSIGVEIDEVKQNCDLLISL